MTWGNLVNTTGSSPSLDALGEEEKAAYRALMRRRWEVLKIMLRQGDILLQGWPELPKGLSLCASKVLARGEVTGHTHELLEGSVWTDDQGTLYLEVPQATQVVHLEHCPLDLAPGYYRVIRQREYTPEAIRRVSD